MDFLLTKRYSWLCLCLLVCSIWFSCAVQNQTHPATVPVNSQGSTIIWILKIRLLPGSDDLVFPVFGLQGINAADRFTGITFPGNYGRPIILEYRFNSESQCRMTLDQLLGTGMVNVISMTKQSNEHRYENQGK